MVSPRQALHSYKLVRSGIEATKWMYLRLYSTNCRQEPYASCFICSMVVKSPFADTVF